MVASAVRKKKRPCSECRRWFEPHARIGDRQRTCGAEECQRARHRKKDRAWHARHPDYDRGRRWQKAQQETAAATKAGSAPRYPVRPPPLSGVPWDIAQDAMSPQALVIVAGVAEVLVRHAQEEMRKQVADSVRESGGVGRGGLEDEIVSGPQPVQRVARGRGPAPARAPASRSAHP